MALAQVIFLFISDQLSLPNAKSKRSQNQTQETIQKTRPSRYQRNSILLSFTRLRSLVITR